MPVFAVVEKDNGSEAIAVTFLFLKTFQSFSAVCLYVIIVNHVCVFLLVLLSEIFVFRLILFAFCGFLLTL